MAPHFKVAEIMLREPAVLPECSSELAVLSVLLLMR
jgi:hypothetical protein